MRGLSWPTVSCQRSSCRSGPKTPPAPSGLRKQCRSTFRRSGDFEADDYRFHEVFHLAFAGILGWSPVLRSLLSLPRRSRPDFDEVQDGARAKITEEGISNWVFSHGLRHEAFEHVDSPDFALLKTIGQMVKGYEAETLMPWMWSAPFWRASAPFASFAKTGAAWSQRTWINVA